MVRTRWLILYSPISFFEQPARLHRGERAAGPADPHAGQEEQPVGGEGQMHHHVDAARRRLAPGHHPAGSLSPTTHRPGQPMHPSCAQAADELLGPRSPDDRRSCLVDQLRWSPSGSGGGRSFRRLETPAGQLIRPDAKLSAFFAADPTLGSLPVDQPSRGVLRLELRPGRFTRRVNGEAASVQDRRLTCLLCIQSSDFPLSSLALRLTFVQISLS